MKTQEVIAMVGRNNSGWTGLTAVLIRVLADWLSRCRGADVHWSGRIHAITGLCRHVKDGAPNQSLNKKK